ncbi:MAG: YdcF family protein [Micavibrio sp.]
MAGSKSSPVGISAAFARAVQDYLLIERTSLTHADFALIFGNKQIIDPLADEAADLYFSAHVPLLVASGGVRTTNGLSEAEALRQALLVRGVPDDVILVEPKARHTGENVTLTRALLQQQGLEAGMGSVISIGHIVAARRFLMTLERHWPSLHKMHVSANPFNVSAAQWHSHNDFRRHAIKEWSKISPYLAQGLIAEIDLPALEQETGRRIKALQASGP